MKAVFSILFLPQIGDVLLEHLISMTLLITSSGPVSRFVSNLSTGAKMEEEARRALSLSLFFSLKQSQNLG